MFSRELPVARTKAVVAFPWALHTCNGPSRAGDESIVLKDSSRYHGVFKQYAPLTSISGETCDPLLDMVPLQIAWSQRPFKVNSVQQSTNHWLVCQPGTEIEGHYLRQRQVQLFYHSMHKNLWHKHHS